VGRRAPAAPAGGSAGADGSSAAPTPEECRGRGTFYRSARSAAPASPAPPIESSGRRERMMDDTGSLGVTQRRERITAPAPPSLELAELGLDEMLVLATSDEMLVLATSVHVDHARQTFVTSRAGGMEHGGHGGHGDPCHFGLRSSERIAVLHGDSRRRMPSLGLGGPRCGGTGLGSTGLGGTGLGGAAGARSSRVLTAALPACSKVPRMILLPEPPMNRATGTIGFDARRTADGVRMFRLDHHAR